MGNTKETSSQTSAGGLRHMYVHTYVDPPPSAVQVSGYEAPPYKRDNGVRIHKREKKGTYADISRGDPLLHFPNYPLVHRCGTSSVPSAVVLPTPDSSRYLTKRLSYLGLANNTLTPPGSFPSLWPTSASRSDSGEERESAPS
jgi:hypothetical protein